MEQNYCRRCGAPLTSANDTAYKCANDHMIFSNPAPTAGVFLLDTDGRIVLSIRGIDPGKGRLDTIGGFVDGDESFEQALEREIREETGLEPSDYSTPTYLTSAPSEYPYGGESRSVLSCFYVATLTSGATPEARDDVGELVRVAPDDLVIDDLWSNDTRVAARVLLGVIT